MDNNNLKEYMHLIKQTGFIESINIYRNMNEDSDKIYELEIVFSTCPYYEEDSKIKMIFHKVQEFKLGNINNFCKIILEIVDVTDRQLEGIGYYVDEIEYNMISFVCEDFEFECL